MEAECDTPNWQREMQRAITDPSELIRLLELDIIERQGVNGASRQFPLKVPRPFLTRMVKGDPEDPLLQQVLPMGSEMNAKAGYSLDPLAEHPSTKQQDGRSAGIIQKYHGRVLLMVSSHCAVHCRYCFRRHFPYQQNRLNRQQWRQVIAGIAADPTISEVIYSGGDPLALSDHQLAWLTRAIAAIPHIKRLRIHSRLPVVIPSRINASCIDWMTHTRLQTVVVLHINHANEIDDQLAAAAAKLHQAGITLLNQAVLLKGINDDADCLATLSERLFSVNIMPYYLNLLDKVKGAEHFDINEDAARAIYRQLLSRLPGYLAPKMVREVPDMGYKLPFI